MLKPEKKTEARFYQLDAFENYIEFSCFTDQFLTGMDFLGNEGDVISFEESLEIDIYENLKKMEGLKHALNAEYIKHVSIAKSIYSKNIEKQYELGLNGVINFDMDCWMEHVKVFYITILSNIEILEVFYNYGISLENIESAVEMMIQLEDYIIENQKESEIWN